MTHPTKAIAKMLLTDSVKVGTNPRTMLFDEGDVNKSMDRVEVIDYHQVSVAVWAPPWLPCCCTSLLLSSSGAALSWVFLLGLVSQELEHNGIKFWCYNAGHVLGAAMFMVEIAGVKVRCEKSACSQIFHSFLMFVSCCHRTVLPSALSGSSCLCRQQICVVVL